MGTALGEWFDGDVEVIPAVDVLGNESVRLERGDYDAIVERPGDPVSLAQQLCAAGAGRLHVVDLDGARTGTVRPEIVTRLAALGTPVQASGGIRSLDDARALLDAGADRVVVGTAAWPDPEPWFVLGDALVLALDVRDGLLRSAGWTQATGVTLATAVERAQGTRILLTAIERDGTLAGPDVDLVRNVASSNPHVLAAGGVRSPKDAAVLVEAGAEAVIVGRAFVSSLSARPA